MSPEAQATEKRSFSTLQRVEIAEIRYGRRSRYVLKSFSTLQRVEIAEIQYKDVDEMASRVVSVLFNESKLLKFKGGLLRYRAPDIVSVLFNESKLLKYSRMMKRRSGRCCFSTLQRVEIAEIVSTSQYIATSARFSTLQRVEIAEMDMSGMLPGFEYKFQYSSTSRNC